MSWYHRALRGPALWLGSLLLLPALIGCGQPTGHVSGKVLFKGEPLPGGRLTFRPADARLNAVSATIGEDGRYDLTLPVGEVTIAVDNRELQPPARGGGGQAIKPPPFKLPGQGGAAKAAEAAPTSGGGKLTGRYVPIPEKFYQVESSGLKYTVKTGPDTHDINLE